MSDDAKKERLLKLRRPPMPFDLVTLIDTQEISPRLLRLRLEGDVVRGLEVDQPAMSVRFVVPWPDEADLVLPEWNGNEFLRADGSRPALRTFTPLDIDNSAGQVTLEIVRHPHGAVSSWAERSQVGAVAGLSGVSAGYEFPAEAERLLVLGDETAIPAIRQLVDAAPESTRLDVHIEIVSASAEIELGDRQAGELTVTWHVTTGRGSPGDALANLVEADDSLPDNTFVWAAGEASAMQRIRNHLFKTLKLPRGRAAIRGYWKLPR